MNKLCLTELRDFIISYVSSTSQFFSKPVTGMWLVVSNRGNYNIYSIYVEWTLKTEFLREWIRFHPIKIDAARDNFLKIKCGPPVKKVAHACFVAIHSGPWVKHSTFFNWEADTTTMVSPTHAKRAY